ncbi:MAG: polyprenol monophosphomannose synthase [Deltaproteobacteria bacterium]
MFDTKTLVVIPTYNEKNNIELLVNDIFAVCPGTQILIVDDNSPDGTGSLAESLSRKYPYLHVIRRNAKSGLGSAYKEGFRWALPMNFNYIFQMDADLSHDPSDMTRMMEKINSGADLVIGSRYLDGVRVKGRSLFRMWLSRVANWHIRTILGTGIHDMTSGFRCFRACTLKNINFDTIRAEGYAFQIEMAYLYLKKGFKVEESHIIFTEREKGKSKFSIKIAIEAFFTVLRIKFFDVHG